MTILFRADASAVIGTGHLMRCLALADYLKMQGEECIFICRSVLVNVVQRIADGGHQLVLLPPTTGLRNPQPGDVPHADWLEAYWRDDAEATRKVASSIGARWLVVDHYAIDARWESIVNDENLRIAVIDDLADRRHDCEILIDSNIHLEPFAVYAGLVPIHCQRLFGPRYALLRVEFTDLGKFKRIYKSEQVNYLVAFGGVDLANHTMTALQALESVCRPADHVDVIMSDQHNSLDAVAVLCAARGWHLHLDSTIIAQLIQKADIAIGAGGGMLWERMATGLPSIAVAVAANQNLQVSVAADMGFLLQAELGYAALLPLPGMILKLRDDLQLRENLSKACLAVVDGCGTKRVAQRLLQGDIHMRLAAGVDSDDLLVWRNDEKIRKFSSSSSVISGPDHVKWFDSSLANSQRDLLIAEDDIGPLGVVRFDRNSAIAEISIYLVPTRIGSGAGNGLLLAAEKWLCTYGPGVEEIRALVLEGNTASNELFRSCGYTKQGNNFVKRLEVNS